MVYEAVEERMAIRHVDDILIEDQGGTGNNYHEGRDDRIEKYEVVDEDDSPLLMIDLHPQGYSAKWYTGLDLNGFREKLDEGIGNVEAIFFDEEEDRGWEEGGIREIESQERFPDDCSYFEAQYENYSIAWLDEGEQNSVILSSFVDDVTPLNDYYGVMADKVDSEEEVEVLAGAEEILSR